MILSVGNVSKSFGVDQILTGVSFRIDAREKVALVGRNGVGKTTLLKIVTGRLDPDAGSVQLARGAKLGYLRQEQPVTSGRTVLEEAQAGLERSLELKRRLEELEARIEAGASEEELEEYALLHEHFLDAEGYSAERDVRVVLQRVGFTEDEFDKPTDALSGGEKTRLAIGRLLLEEPDLLILDEPTNHLDLQATEWLERWIKSYHGAVLLVSHDRAFLESTAERVLDMRVGDVKSYPGPFAKYLELRREEEERLAAVADRQEKEIAKLDEYVRRFMNSQRTAQARGRQKIMNRLIESKVEAPKNEKGMAAGFKAVARSGDLVLATEDLDVGYPGVKLIKGLNWTVRRGERWGVIGENGAGKSSLIKTTLGLLEPLAGGARLGAGVAVGYFSQDVADLDPDESPLDFMVYECGMLPPDARNLLGRFLFGGDDVFRPIRTLSGGEKNKLVLARLTQLNPNLLVLDEPTNHLDMASREALAEVLGQYTGTLLLISHDRWLLGQVTDRLLDVRREGAVAYPGSYADYRRRTAAPARAPEPPRSAKTEEAPAESGLSPRELSKEIQRVTKLVEQLEAQVTENEAALAALEAQLAAPAPEGDILELTHRHAALQDAVAGSLSAWEEQASRLEELRALQG